MITEDSVQIMKDWFDSISQGDMEAIIGRLADNIVFELPLYEHNKIIPYLGVMNGPAEVARAFQIRGETTEVLDYETRGFVGQGNEVWAIVYTRARCTETQVPFEIEDAHRFVLSDEGKIARWKVYFDSYLEVAAFKENIDDRLIAAVQRKDLERTKYLLEMGANPSARDAESGLTVLMMAAGRANPEMVKVLMDAGADVFTADSRAGSTALHKACQGGSVEVVRLLVEAGALVDSIAPTTGHTPLMDALWFKYPDIVQYLLDKGAGLNLSTHYGFSLLQHFEYELNVNVIGKDKLLEAEKMIQARQQSDQAKIESQKLMKAVTDNDVGTVRKLIVEGVDVDERYPFMNGFNDYHTPLLVACRDGHTEIVTELLNAGADVNATEPTFGAVPLHKAVYNGHADITQILVKQSGINLDYQGATNGYTPLHDALWHGYEECAKILIEAGARLDLPGHDGKLPVDIAVDTLGDNHEMVRLIGSK
jgi:ankyrin repeat protein